MKTIDYLNQINHDLNCSDYKAAQLLGVTRSAVSRYRQKKNLFDDAVAVKAAKLLEIDASVVLANIHLERAKDKDVKKVWLQIMEAMKQHSTALSVLLVTGSVLPKQMDNFTAILIMLNKLF